MKYRDLGRTGIKVSAVGFGAWAIGGNLHGNSYGPTEDKTSIDAIEKALDLGCNFFDTADSYGWGHSEELLGKTLKGKRDRVIIATKVGSDFYQGYGYQTFTPDYVRFALDKSLERLRTDYIDLYQFHNPPLSVIEDKESFVVLEKLKAEGKIRAWGVSVGTYEEGLAALKVTRPDSLQVPYNMFMKESEADLFPQAATMGCAIIAREPLSNGFLTGKYDMNPNFDSGDVRKAWPKDFVNARVQASQRLAFLAKNGSRTLAQSAIQWVLNCQSVAVVIPGIKTPEQAAENLSSVESPHLTQEELASIESLKNQKFGL